MLKSERHTYMAKAVEQNGRLIVSDMAKELLVTEDTIRKDLSDMAKKGLIKRVHGGAVRSEKEIPEFAKRTDLFVEEKAQLTSKAISLLKDNMSIFIDGGTTNLQLADKIPFHYNGTIITNNPLIPIRLVSHPNIVVTLIGGLFDKISQVTFGSAAFQAIQEVHPDLCFVGLSSIDIAYGITVSSYEESIIKRELIKASSICVGIATLDKIGKVAAFTVGDVDVLDYLILEDCVSPAVKEQFEERGITVI